MPDTIFIFALALIIFGPKKLPEIGRQLGKLVGEFRRASNEFKMQIEDELRSAEQSDRQKQLAAADAGGPVAAAVETRELPDSLAVRPPSTGEIESTESPFRPYSQEGYSSLEDDYSRDQGMNDYPLDQEISDAMPPEGDPLDPHEGAAGALEEQTVHGYSLDEGALENTPPEPETLGSRDGAAGAPEEHAIHAYSRDEGVLENTPPEPETLSSREGAAGALEEQTTHRHG